MDEKKLFDILHGSKPLSCQGPATPLDPLERKTTERLDIQLFHNRRPSHSL
uniref:Uncharacterized protein n=1 Tax=Utricularia reniformis TaxID=192314 RepID=A0A1Y0B4U8_9LAMI|nr:hypothetical protein AEK19_MT2269 [Utricularia reniformis]ART32414.1 hypothetical protein AEK19_MT2269 [Utricularia reniformis]